MGPPSPNKLSAGVVVVRRTPRGHQYLLLRAYHYWDFPKGGVEAGETPFQAARREAKEETGITDLEFRWGEVFQETDPYGQNKIARYYLAETRSEAIILPVSSELGRPEHHEYRWLSKAEAEKLLVARVQKILHWAQSIIQDS